MPNVPNNRKRQSLTRLLLGILHEAQPIKIHARTLNGTGEITSKSNLYPLQQLTLSFLPYSQLHIKEVHMYIMFQLHLS